jgi:hypothetical protein
MQWLLHGDYYKMKPCGHVVPKFSGQLGSPDYCRVCFLYETDPAYRALWDSEPLTPRGPCHRECVRRGLPLRSETCPSCRGAVQIKVFACQVHGECTVAKVVKNIDCCGRCDDFVPTVASSNA